MAKFRKQFTKEEAKQCIEVQMMQYYCNCEQIAYRNSKRYWSKSDKLIEALAWKTKEEANRDDEEYNVRLLEKVAYLKQFL